MYVSGWYAVVVVQCRCVEGRENVSGIDDDDDGGSGGGGSSGEVHLSKCLWN